VRPIMSGRVAPITAAALTAGALAAALATGCAQPAGVPGTGGTRSGAPQPYAGLERRAIKALEPQRVADLLAGRGAGYALAAELNHYPGPAHVLELRDGLQLSPEQERATRDVFAAMQRDARVLGEQLVALEARLDAAFAGGAATAADVSRLTEEIAAVEGRLRAVHLAAHLEQKALLTPEQVARYDRLRGYAGTAESSGATGAASHHGQGASHGAR
jgi:hypothetical protein